MRYIFLSIAVVLLLVLVFYTIYINKKLYKTFTKKEPKLIIVLIISILWYLPIFIFKGIWLVFILYVLITFVIVDIILFMLKLFKINLTKKYFLILQFLISAIFTVYGYSNAHNIVKTSYEVTTDKYLSKEYKIGLISDVHYGSSLNIEDINKYVLEINNEHLDFLVLAGDIVDEQTYKEAYRTIFNTLGKINTKYGIYYIHGNHDENRYINVNDNRNELLLKAIKDANIKILNEESTEINNDIILTGRIDYSYRNYDLRKEALDLVKHLDSNKYLIVADHQPKPYKENKDAGYDLQLSGHTHAGQIWPFGFVTKLLSFDYGKLEEDKFNLIVSSGFGVWGVPLRTEEHSEYVIINIKNK